MAGIASLFTREFFAGGARRGSRPGGVLCQWAHTYDISADDLQSIVATFASVFPDGTLWLVGDGDVLLVGGTEPLVPRIAAMDQRLGQPRAMPSPTWTGSAPAIRSAWYRSWWPKATGSRRFAAGAPMLTDDYARVEFSGPRTVFSRAGADNAAALRALAAELPLPVVDAARAAAGAAQWRNRGWMLLEASAPRAAWSDFEAALRREPGDRRALEGLVRAGAAASRVPETVALLRELAAPPDRVEAQVALSRLLASTGAVQEAAGIAFAAAERHPSDVGALEQLASVLSDVGDKERLLPVVSRLRTIAPTADATRYYSASLLFLDGRTDQAIAEARVLVDASPGHARGAQPARRRAGHGRSARGGTRRLPGVARRPNRAIPPLTRTWACSNSRPATAPPACSGWPRR